MVLPTLLSPGDNYDDILLKGRGETILVLEDETVVLNLIRMMLGRLGYNVITANSPSEAKELAKAHDGKIDLLLTDVVMPEMNGREFANQLNGLFPEIKVLFMSGYTANVIAHHTVLDEVVNFIEKPFSINRLAVKVRESLD
jgi:two-component system, cell cycle sensor histidine kinase and response regulator CckA